MPWVLPRGAYQCQHFDSSPPCRSADTCLAIIPLAQGKEILGKNNPPVLLKKKQLLWKPPCHQSILNLYESSWTKTGMFHFSYFISRNLRNFLECTTSQHAIRLITQWNKHKKISEKDIINVKYEGQVLKPCFMSYFSVQLPRQHQSNDPESTGEDPEGLCEHCF